MMTALYVTLVGLLFIVTIGGTGLMIIHTAGFLQLENPDMSTRKSWHYAIGSHVLFGLVIALLSGTPLMMLFGMMMFVPTVLISFFAYAAISNYIEGRSY